MYGNSYFIHSSQTGIHHQLHASVARHATTRFMKPIADYNRAAFAQSMAAWHAAGDMPLILDAGCGVGRSSLHLATRFPNHFIVGVDQSADRLARHKDWPEPLPANLTWVRADLVDYWRLMQEAGVRPARHYLLYPNPWPKIGHVGRRWHGHAIFPTIVALGGTIECRSNWKIYIEEFASALSQLSAQGVACESFAPASPITPFEEKYLASGHQLWRCRAEIAPSDNTQLAP